MKRGLILCAIVILLLNLTSCKQEAESISMEPKVTQMKSICELAAMESYYHNVAKFKEEDAEGTLWWKKDKHFWIEYSGIVRLGLDASLITMEVNDTAVTITLPEAKVLGCKVDSTSLNEDSFIVAKDSAEIMAEDEVAAFEEAQRQLEENASNDRTLLARAQQRVQSLLEEYIANIGQAIGKNYSINWVYLDAEGNPLGTSVTQSIPSEDSSAGQGQDG